MVKSEDTIRSKFQSMFKNRVEKQYRLSTHSYRQFDFEWISVEQQKFENVFDLNKSKLAPSVKRNIIVSFSIKT